MQALTLLQKFFSVDMVIYAAIVLVAERESPRKCMSFHDFFSLFCLLSVTMVRAARRSLAATRESGMVQRASAVAATSTIAA